MVYPSSAGLGLKERYNHRKCHLKTKLCLEKSTIANLRSASEPTMKNIWAVILESWNEEQRKKYLMLCLKYCDDMANSADPDQAAPGSALFALTLLRCQSQLQ